MKFAKTDQSNSTRNKSRKARPKANGRASSFVANNRHEIISKFGAAIRQRRESLSMTQTELATLAELNRSYLSDVERGKTSISIERADRLAKALKCDLRDLL